MKKLSSKNYNKSMSVRYQKSSLVNILAQQKLFIFETSIDSLHTFDGLSNEHIGFWFKCFHAEKLGNAQTSVSIKISQI
jgi:hypothetical protein